MTRSQLNTLIESLIFFNNAGLIDDVAMREAMAGLADYTESAIADTLDSSPAAIALLAEAVANSATILDLVSSKQSISEKNQFNGYQGLEANGDVLFRNDAKLPVDKGLYLKRKILASTFTNQNYSSAVNGGNFTIAVVPGTYPNVRIEFKLAADSSTDFTWYLTSAGFSSLPNGSTFTVNTDIVLEQNRGSNIFWNLAVASGIVKFAYLRFYQVQEIVIDATLLNTLEKTTNRNVANGYMALGNDAKAAKANLPADILYTALINAANGILGIGADNRAAKANLPTDIQYTGLKNAANGYSGLDENIRIQVSQLQNIIDNSTDNAEDKTWSSQQITDYVSDLLSGKANTSHTHILSQIVDYNEKFKGKFTTLGALQTAHPTSTVGSYAQVDAGTGSDVINYNWDAEEGWVEGSSSGPSISNTDELTEGSINLYFQVARVLASVLGDLTGSVVNTPINSSDTVKAALGKLQGQINSEQTTRNNADTTLQTNIDAITATYFAGGFSGF